MSLSFGGLIRLPMVLRHLNAIFTFEFLNRFVILRVCWEIKVNIAHFFLFLFMFLCCAVCFDFCFIWRLNFCNIVGGKPLRCAMRRIVSHSLFLVICIKWETKHPLNVISVCCQFVFITVVR